MIVRPKPNLLQLFLIVRGSIIVRIFPQVLAVFLLSTLVVWAHKDRPDLVPALNGAPFSLLGIALSVFLGFRANACYDRWWEARKQWGALITVARTLSRQTVMLEGRQDVADPVTRRRITDLVIAFCHALVSHLRPANATVTTDLIPEDLSLTYARSRNRPDMLLREISGAIVSAPQSAAARALVATDTRDKTMKTMKLLALLFATGIGGMSPALAHNDSVGAAPMLLADSVREANSRFQDVAVAEREGYTPIPCASSDSIPCNAEVFKASVSPLR